MNWNVSAWSIRNPLPAILLFIVLVALGLVSFAKLPVTRFPNIDVPLVSVTVTDPGVAPSELETQVTKRIEDAVANLSGVKNVISTLTDGRWQTVVEHEGVHHQEDRQQYVLDLGRYAWMRRAGWAYVQSTSERLRHPRSLVGWNRAAFPFWTRDGGAAIERDPAAQGPPGRGVTSCRPRSAT